MDFNKLDYRAWVADRNEMFFVTSIDYRNNECELSNTKIILFKDLKDVILFKNTFNTDYKGITVFEGDILCNDKLGEPTEFVKVIWNGQEFMLESIYLVKKGKLEKVSEEPEMYQLKYSLINRSVVSNIFEFKPKNFKSHENQTSKED
jgi:hypothetical protein